MYHVEIQFANKRESQSFHDRTAASAFAYDLLEMFEGEEMWFDKGSKTYIVTVPRMEIVA